MIIDIDINNLNNVQIIDTKDLKKLAKKYNIKIMKTIYVNNKPYYIKKYDAELYSEIDIHLKKLEKNIQDALKE